MRLVVKFLLACSLVTTTLGVSYAQTTAGLRCEFNLGTGPNELQTVGGVGDSTRFREYSTVVFEDELIVFDPLSQRVLRRSFGTSGCKGNTSTATLPNNGDFVLRLSALGNALYGLTASGKIRLVARYFKGEPLRVISPGQESGDIEQTETVQALFVEQLPVLPNTSAVFDSSVTDHVPRANEAGYTSSLVRSYSAGLTSSEDGAVLRYRVRLCSSSVGRLDVWSADEPNKVSTAVIGAPESSWLGVVSLVGAKSSTSFSVMYQSMIENADGIFKTSIYVLDHVGSDGRVAVATFADGQAISSPEIVQVVAPRLNRRFVVASYLVSISGSGPKRERLRIVALPVKESTISVPEPLRSDCESGSVSWAPRQLVGSDMNREQDFVISRARAFIDATWCMQAENLRIGGTCEPPFDRPANSWKQPFSAAFIKPGETVKGVYYLWGGKDSLEKILARYGSSCAGATHKRRSNLPALAGNVCTKIVNGHPARHPDAAGIDCSGFVSQAWNIPQTPGTSEMLTSPAKYGLSIGQPLDAMMVADGLLYRTKSSGHVRLFGGWVVTPLGLRARVYESTTESVCSGTCERDLDFLQIAGYRPLALKRLRVN